MRNGFGKEPTVHQRTNTTQNVCDIRSGLVYAAAIAEMRENPMHEIHLQLTEQVYRQANQRAVEAGFAGLDEFLADAVSELVSEEVGDETEIINRLFTPEVISDLDRIHSAVQAGGKTYSPEEVDEHFRQKSQAWREAHGN